MSFLKASNLYLLIQHMFCSCINYVLSILHISETVLNMQQTPFLQSKLWKKTIKFLLMIVKSTNQGIHWNMMISMKNWLK